ncbi:MAG: hypothetical protein V4618_00790 [Pseudomonadota bacterium]
MFRPHAAGTKREVDLRRGSASERGYDGRWAKASASYRREHPLCAYCALLDKVAAASLVDHLYPHRVYDGVFWERDWWVSSCGPCHSGMKQAVERQGRSALDRLAARLGRPIMGGRVESPGPHAS